MPTSSPSIRRRNAAWPWTITACLAVLPLAAAAQAVALTGVLGNRALLVVDGTQPRGVAPGETYRGVKVVAVGRDDAVVEIGGQRHTCLLYTS